MGKIIGSIQLFGSFEVVLGVLATLYAALSTVFFKLIKEKKLQSRRKFTNALINGLETESVECLDDVLNIYNGISTNSYDTEESRHFAGRRLRKFLVDMLTGELNDAKKEMPREKVKAWKNLITAWLDELKRETPYSDLPQAERSVLQELGRLIDKNEIEGIRGRINDLAGMIQVRNEEHEKSKKINRWTVPLSIAGLILTLVSTAYGIYFSSRPIKLDTSELKNLIEYPVAQATIRTDPNK